MSTQPAEPAAPSLVAVAPEVYRWLIGFERPLARRYFAYFLRMRDGRGPSAVTSAASAALSYAVAIWLPVSALIGLPGAIMLSFRNDGTGLFVAGVTLVALAAIAMATALWRSVKCQRLRAACGLRQLPH